jgi:hypothetical protein
MLDIRREAQEEYESYRRQAWQEYESDFNQYKRLSDWERHILDKFRSQNTPLSEMITDITSFKFQWYKKRIDSELKRTLLGK